MGRRTSLLIPIQSAPIVPQLTDAVSNIAWGMAFVNPSRIHFKHSSLCPSIFIPKKQTRRSFDSKYLSPDKTTPGNDPYSAPQISPDGRRLAFAASSDGKVQLSGLLSLDSIAARALPDTDGAYFPFWSPDSRYIGFFTPGKTQESRSGR